MESGLLNLYIRNGDTYARSFTFAAGDSTPIDLTGCVAEIADCGYVQRGWNLTCSPAKIQPQMMERSLLEELRQPWISLFRQGIHCCLPTRSMNYALGLLTTRS